MTIRNRLLSCSVLLALSLACGAPRSIGPVSSPVTLDVPGRADSTPWLAASGPFVAVAWGATGNGRTDVFLAVSRDGGSTFGHPVQVNPTAGDARLGGEFPPRVALAPRSGNPVPEVVVLWTSRGDGTGIKIARSSDGGGTFAAPVTLQADGAAGDRGWPSLALDSQANVHAIWLDHRGLATKPEAGAHPAGHGGGEEHDGVAMAQKSGLYYASVGAGTSPERQITNGVCYCCKTAMAAGPDGSVYAAWRHVYPGNLRDMAFTMSRDGGRTFSPPARVSEDGWAINGCPDDGPAMALDADGGVHLAWPTVVGGATPEGALFYAATRDGLHFTPRVRIPTLGGPKPSHPQIVVDRGGRIFVAWDEGVDGRRVAALRELRLADGGAPSFGDVVMLAGDGPAAYPTLAATDRGLVAVWTTGGNQSRVEVGTLSTR